MYHQLFAVWYMAGSKNMNGRKPEVTFLIIYVHIRKCL